MRSQILMNASITLITLAFSSSALLAQSVQQPTVKQFSAQTSVSVPDQGEAFIGRVNRSARSGQVASGWPRTRIRSSDVESSTLSTKVYLHDFETIDKMLLESDEPEFPPYHRSYLASKRAELRPFSISAENPLYRRRGRGAYSNISGERFSGVNRWR